tara:strand:+ start:676 stop:882 length:207 start_codon:yes stop_codon:yes gene_type:complete
MNSLPEDIKIKPIDNISIDISRISHEIQSIRNDIQYIKILIHANEMKIENEKIEQTKSISIGSGWFFS